MPRLRLRGRGRDLEDTLEHLRDQGMEIYRIFSRADELVVQAHREDVGQVRRAWACTDEVYPTRHRAVVLHEAYNSCTWYGEERHLIQSAIADATQYAVQRFAAGEVIGEGMSLGVVCYYDQADSTSDETFTVAARYIPDEGGWVEVL